MEFKKIILVVVLVIVLVGTYFFVSRDMTDESTSDVAEAPENIDLEILYTVAEIDVGVDGDVWLVGEYFLRSGTDLSDDSIEFFELGELTEDESSASFIDINVKDLESDLYITSGDYLLIKGSYDVSEPPYFFRASEIYKIDADEYEDLLVSREEVL